MIRPNTIKFYFTDFYRNMCFDLNHVIFRFSVNTLRKIYASDYIDSKVKIIELLK